MRTRVGTGSLQLRGDNAQWRIEVSAHSPLAEALVLPVPLVEDGVLAPGALEAQLAHLEVRLWRRGRPHWQASTELAAMETGGRQLAEDELARRGENPTPQRP